MSNQKERNRRFRGLTQIFKRKELTQGSQEKQKPQKLTTCLFRHNRLLNKELQCYNKKTAHKKQGHTRLYYECLTQKMHYFLRHRSTQILTDFLNILYVFLRLLHLAAIAFGFNSWLLLGLNGYIFIRALTTPSL